MQRGFSNAERRALSVVSSPLESDMRQAAGHWETDGQPTPFRAEATKPGMPSSCRSYTAGPPGASASYGRKAGHCTGCLARALLEWPHRCRIDERMRKVGSLHFRSSLEDGDPDEWREEGGLRVA